MDRNTIIGMFLIMAMLLGYNAIMPTPEPQKEPEKTAKVAPQKTVVPKISTPTDTATAKTLYGDFGKAAIGTAQDLVVENADVKFTFSNQGGKIKQVELKNYKTFDGQPLLLLDPEANQLSIEIPTNTGKIDVSKLFFTATQSSNQVVYTLQLSQNQSITQTYKIPTSGYQIEQQIQTAGLEGLVKGTDAHVTWQKFVRHTEYDLSANRQSSTVNYYTNDGEFDNLSETPTGSGEEALELPAKWLSFKQKYFVSGLVSQKNDLKNVKVYYENREQDTVLIKSLKAEYNVPLADLKAGKVQYTWFFGPNDYREVSKVTEGFWRNVYLGYEIFKPINRFVFVPLFNFLEGFITNYGLLILVLVLIIKLVLTPLVYRSYISMAKMRVLAPEINALKEKIGDDTARLQQEQMKLYGQVGVSPLSGCVPVVLQMPILMSVFFLFPNLIQLRQQPFLWAKDLSTYDNLIHWSTHLPIIGSHLSIFTVLMTISSIAYAYYNNQITPDQPGQPIDMKKLGYVMPVVFMFVLNSFPAGLSFYYFVSNLVTIAQQLIIRRFVDEDKIKRVLDETRKKIAAGGGPKKSKFSELMEKSLKAAEEQRKAQEPASKKNMGKKK